MGAITAGRRARALVAVSAMALAALLALFAAATVLAGPARSDDAVTLDRVPEGVSLQNAGGRAVVVVRDGDDIDAFAAAVVGPQFDSLMWCVDVGVFVSEHFGTMYRSDGSLVSGPGQRHLWRYDTEVDGERLVISRGKRWGQPDLPWTPFAAARFARPSWCPMTGPRPTS